MEDDNFTFLVPSCSTIAIPDVPVTTQIVEEGPRVCPLCSSEVRFFYINFNEKMLMCENTHCEFPFGHETLQFVCVDGSEESDLVSHRQRSISSSGASAAAWSEIEKASKAYDVDDYQRENEFECKIKRERRPRRLSKKDIDIDQIEKNVNDIKGLNMELVELSNQKGIIKNEKWIKKLKSLSGNQFLKPQELDQLKKKKPRKEVKINIQSGDYKNTISSIKIDITHQIEE